MSSTLGGSYDWGGIADSTPTTRHPRRGRPEAKIQKQIVAWLLSKGVLLAVTDAGALNRAGLNMSCGIPTGWPDITCCLPGGRFLGIECKAPKGVQSSAQIKFGMAIEKRGGIYILARSLAEVIEALRQEEILELLK